tara:strand:+ start:6827 stop:7228 length:402 start_codon:yes stop_codon:yes gene_type:complete
MAMPEGDPRQEQAIKERFFAAVMALGPFIGQQCGAEDAVRIVLEEDLATEFISCEDDEDWQMFGYSICRLPIDGEFVCVEFGTSYHPDNWMFHDFDTSPELAKFQINVHNMVVGGFATSTIVTIAHVFSTIDI